MRSSTEKQLVVNEKDLEREGSLQCITKSDDIIYFVGVLGEHRRGRLATIGGG